MIITIKQVRAGLLAKWKTDSETFKTLRNDCGTYVFDAVMAVLLGGTGSSKPEHKAYLAIISNTGDVGAWKANAGLKANRANGYNNYQQRGFFDFPIVDNKKLGVDFPEELTIEAVYDVIRSYPRNCFRSNARNTKSSPVSDFIATLDRIVLYAMQSKTDYSFGDEKEKNKSSHGGNDMSTMKEVYAYLGEKEPQIADSICYASELLLTEIDSALAAMKKRRIEATENDDDLMLKRLTDYRNALNSYKNDISDYLNSFSECAETQENTESLSRNVSPVDYSLYVADIKKPHSLNEDFMHKKIGAFVYEGAKFKVNTWKDALILLCNLLAKEYPDKFSTIVHDDRFVRRKHQYYSNTYVPGKNEKIYNTKVYVWVNLSANAIVELMKDTLMFFSKNVDDFAVYLRADYTSLHKNNV